jgi:hypothetical protein
MPAMDNRHSSPWLAATAIGLGSALNQHTLTLHAIPRPDAPPGWYDRQTRTDESPRRPKGRRRPARRNAQNQGRR